MNPKWYMRNYFCGITVALFLSSFLDAKEIRCAAEENTHTQINFSDPMFSELDESGKNLLREYAISYLKIKKFYKDVRIDVTEKDTRFFPKEEQLVLRQMKTERLEYTQEKPKYPGQSICLAENKIQEEYRYEVRYNLSNNGGCYARIDKFQVDQSQPNLANEYQRNITLVTPAMGYELSKRNYENQFYAINIKNKIEVFMHKHGVPLLMFDTAPFCSNATPLEDIIFGRLPFLNGKPYMIKYVKLNEIECEQVVEIMCACTHSLGSFSRVITLDKNHWGIVKSNLRVTSMTGETTWTREYCTYNDTIDGVPLLKTYQRTSGIFEPASQQERIDQLLMCEVTNFVPGPPDLSEFDVAQFLPPGTKIGELTYTQFSIYRIAAIAFGIILVLIGIFMKIRFAIIEARKQQKE